MVIALVLDRKLGTSSYLGFALLHSTSDDEKDQVDFVEIKFDLSDLVLNAFW
jgi:hypothetical protein